MGSDLTERHYNKQGTTYVSSMTVNQVYQSHLAVILQCRTLTRKLHGMKIPAQVCLTLFLCEYKSVMFVQK